MRKNTVIDSVLSITVFYRVFSYFVSYYEKMIRFIIFIYTQKYNSAVLSGICTNPTLQVTVTGTTPIVPTPVHLWILHASHWNSYNVIYYISSLKDFVILIL